MRDVVVVVVAMVVASGRAEADEWHAGLNLRSELGTHPIRIDGGVRLGRLDLIAVLDPMFWTDGENDIDLIAAWRVGNFAVFGGWRPASIAMATGRQFQHAVLVGAFAPLPKLGPLALTWGLEIATVIVKHGGELPSDVISFDSSADVGDNVNVSMFLRVGVGREM
ncbi:MAG: hypothetical protein M4D80_39515 [Myxococcota bacterium]|nr:hypothetical protein [Myxococcota bacterium]